MRVFGVTGWKNNGKTTLVAGLVSELRRRGYTVSTIKHAHHAFDLDQPGKDSYRHRDAGADEVLIASSGRWALMHELRDKDEPGLEELLSKLSPVDLVIVEGFKREPHPKLEVHRVAAANRTLIARDDPTIRIVASDAPLEGLAVPVVGLDDIQAITDFILAETGLTRSESAAE